MKNNIYKEQVCNKYRKILEIIGIVSKGYILQKQLIQYMLILNIVNSKYKCRQIIEELEYADIIKKITFENTNNKIIMLRKYAIRFLKGKMGSGSVGAISTCTTNKRYYKSIFVNHYIISILKVSKNFLNNAITNGIIKALDINGFNFVLDNLDIYNRLGATYGINKTVIDTHIEKIIKERQLREEILCNAKKGIKAPQQITCNLTNKQKREILLMDATLETLKRKDCYIRFLPTGINVYYFDYCNTQNINKIIENISVVLALTRDLYINTTYKIQFNIWVWDSISEGNIIKKLDKEYIENSIRLYGINMSGIYLWDRLSIICKSIDMYKNYLSNIIKIRD